MSELKGTASKLMKEVHRAVDRERYLLAEVDRLETIIKVLTNTRLGELMERETPLPFIVRMQELEVENYSLWTQLHEISSLLLDIRCGDHDTVSRIQCLVDEILLLLRRWVD